MGTIIKCRDRNGPEGEIMNLHDLTSKILPELPELLQRRYNILKTISFYEPIGRRMLAQETDLGERMIRNEVEHLKSGNFISVRNNGMCLTSEGKSILNELKNMLKDIEGLTNKEEIIRKYLNIKKVIIVPGDCDDDPSVMGEMGRAAANYCRSIMRNNTTISLTGGNSIKAFVDNFDECSKYEDITVLPARGGMGRKVEIQSNTLAAELSNRLNGNYKLLYAPDNMSNIALETMLKEKNISETVNQIRQCDILVYGIGRAGEMARRRELDTEIMDELDRLGAVGEAFGIYFDKHGRSVYCTPTIGIQGEDLSKIENLIAIAGGKSKSGAIIAVEKERKSSVLIIDAGCANEIMNIISSNREDYI